MSGPLCDTPLTEYDTIMSIELPRQYVSITALLAQVNQM